MDVLGGISNPIVQSGVVAVIGLLALWRRRRRTGGVSIVVALAWLWLCATPTFALVLWRGLAGQYPLQPPAAYPQVDAIVLVGGGPLPGRLSKWSAASDPALTSPIGMTLALYRNHKAPRIAISAGQYGTGQLAVALVRQGVPSSALDLTSFSHSTHGDAVYLALMLHAAHARRILLVTTAMHMPRTVATFRKQGFEVIAAPSRHREWIAELPHSLRPDHAGFYLSRSALHEYLGLLWYRLRGWATW